MTKNKLKDIICFKRKLELSFTFGRPNWHMPGMCQVKYYQSEDPQCLHHLLNRILK